MFPRQKMHWVGRHSMGTGSAASTVFAPLRVLSSTAGSGITCLPRHALLTRGRWSRQSVVTAFIASDRRAHSSTWSCVANVKSAVKARRRSSPSRSCGPCSASERSSLADIPPSWLTISATGCCSRYCLNLLHHRFLHRLLFALNLSVGFLVLHVQLRPSCAGDGSVLRPDVLLKALFSPLKQRDLRMPTWFLLCPSVGLGLE